MLPLLLGTFAFLTQKRLEQAQKMKIHVVELANVIDVNKMAPNGHLIVFFHRVTFSLSVLNIIQLGLNILRNFADINLLAVF